MHEEQRSCFGPREGGATEGFFSLFDLPAASFNSEALKDLGKAQAVNVAGLSQVPAGYTYFGQFLVHDLSRLARGDETPNGIQADLNELIQLNTPALDLDSVYGDGLKDVDIALDHATGKMILGSSFDDAGKENHGGDLPRRSDGQARIPDSRNDENLLTAQLHLQFLRLHNCIVDVFGHRDPGVAFESARREVLLHYQAAVLYDFLARILDEKVWQAIIQENQGFIWIPEKGERAMIPTEFSAAAMRFGHSMVLDSYRTGGDGKAISLRHLFHLTGKRGINDEDKLNTSREVDWSLFFPPQSEGVKGFNFARTIKPWVMLTRNKPDAVPNALPASNLLRGKELALPDGQSLARHVIENYPDLAKISALRVLSADEINVKRPGTPWRILDNSAYADELVQSTPLWFYLLAEAQTVHAGNRLGPLASIIIAETVRALTVMSPVSVLREPDWIPLPVPRSERLTMRDLIDWVTAP